MGYEKIMTKIIHNIKTGEIQEIELTAEEITKEQEESLRAEEEKTSFYNSIQTKEDLKASAKAKLIAGEPLTAEEADTIVL